MTNIQNYSNGALLSAATYANFNDLSNNQEALTSSENNGPGFTPSQATAFLAKYDVAYAYTDNISGLSYTIFEEKLTGKKTMSMGLVEMTQFMARQATTTSSGKSIRLYFFAKTHNY